MCSPTTAASPCPADTYEAAYAAGASGRGAFEDAADVTSCRSNIRNGDDGIFNILSAQKLAPHTELFANRVLAALRCVKETHTKFQTPLLMETLEKIKIAANFALALRKTTTNFIEAEAKAGADPDFATDENLVCTALAVTRAWASAAAFATEANLKLVKVYEDFAYNFSLTRNTLWKEAALAIKAHIIDTMIINSPMEEAGDEYTRRHPKLAQAAGAESATPTAPHTSAAAGRRSRHDHRAAEARRAAAALAVPPASHTADSEDPAAVPHAAGSASSAASSEPDPTA
jgi:hypothetical protein